MNQLSLPISIHELIQGTIVEWERIEFKEGWNPENILHSICAFANDFHNLGGGYIIVGIAENNGIPVLPPKGLNQNQMNKIQKELLNLGHSGIRPMYHPISVPYVISQRHILVIWVPGGETRPYQCKVSLAKNKNQWEYYIRIQSSTIPAVKQDKHELLGLAATVPFDDRYCQTETLDAISSSLIADFLHEVKSDLEVDVDSTDISDVAVQMNIAGGPAEVLFPKHVGLMFFTYHPQKYFPCTQIDIVWLPEDAGGDRIEEKLFTGSLSSMVRDALNYIQRSFLHEIILKQPGQAETIRVWNYPFSAIEEALINAVYHRAYEIREPIEVRITPEELSILSYPGPDRSIKLRDLISGKAINRRYRNRRIGEFLKELNLTEGRATGIPKIQRALKNNGSPEAVIETDENRSYFLIRFSIHPNSDRAQEPTQQVTQQVTHQVTHQVKRLLKACAGKKSRTELMKRVRIKDRVSFSKNYLVPAIENELIKPTQPNSPKSPTQKYQLTDKGRQILENTSQ